MTKTQAEYLQLYSSGLTMTEIATIKHINISTVSRTIKRAHISMLKPSPIANPQPSLCEYVFSCHTCPNNAACDTESVHLRKIRILPEPQTEPRQRGRYSY